METKEITITLSTDKDQDGREFYTSNIDEDDLRNLCIALIADDDLSNATLIAAIHILARHHEPQKALAAFSESVREEIKEISKQTR